jgi:hypothetical protein
MAPLAAYAGSCGRGTPELNDSVCDPARRSETAATECDGRFRTQRPQAAPRAALQLAQSKTVRERRSMPQLRCGHGRPDGGRSQVEAHLGCASDLPSLRGPWMAPQA